MTRTDGELLDRIAHRDSRALEALYLRFHRRLSRFLWRVTPRYEDVEEIINDTFMVVWRRAAEFRGHSAVSTWVIGIAYRLALKSLRRPLGAGSVSDVAAAAPSVEPMRVSETEDWVARGLSLLPFEQRLTVELVYHMGHSLQEIADIMGCPVGTVKARMFHAREKLRQSLPQLGGLSAGGGR